MLIYEDELATLYQGDLLEHLHLFTDKQFDLVLTDPPYNCGAKYDVYDDNLDTASYAQWCQEWFVECRRVARRVIIFPGHGNLPTWWQIEKPHGVGCWYKPGNPNRSGGAFQFCEWEPFLVWGQRFGGSDVVRWPVNKQHNVGSHPCPKPVGLMRQLIAQVHAKSVLDPFVGSGTTLVAAKGLRVVSAGVELSPQYCQDTIDRLRQEPLPLDVYPKGFIEQQSFQSWS